MVTLMAVTYSIVVSPKSAVLGEPITAELRLRAEGDAAGALTFEHRSLVLEATRPSLPEPAVAFPNRYAVEGAGGLVRISSPGGIEDLASGDERSRTFDLAVLLPQVVLDVGRFSVTYRLDDAAPPVRPNAEETEIMSGPEAVPLLLRHLGSELSGIRFRAADLLRRMTGRDFDYDAGAGEAGRAEAIGRWWTWWRTEGLGLPWSFQSDGATFGETPAAPPPTHRSQRLGGIAYPGPI